ncbi:MAG TPA: DHA2 family efflux MFS transporter permease subunit [Solirubrobacteraceae bacterium]|nr:DHA2 family efflux MFS transporter permease subunit [Solirubrobacteraceae bacterium]
MTSASASSHRLEPHVARIAVVIVLGAIMSVLDTTIVNVALRDLSLDLHVSLDEIQWVATGYLLALATMLPITTWATRRIGAKRLYIAALVLFTAGSALCGLAWSSTSLIAFRVLQGLGGGIITPVGQTILVRAAGPKNIARVMSAIGVPIVLAPIFGPTLGGLLLEHAGWQWIFLVNVPIGVAAVAVATRLLPSGEREEAGPLDLAGLLLVGPGVALVTYGLAQTGSAGSLTAPGVVIPVLVGLALLLAFVARSLRVPAPLLDLRLFSDPGYRAASITTFALGATLFGAMILMPLYFQEARGEGAVVTGLLLMPQGIGAAFAMHVSARLTERFGAGATTVGGVVVTALSTVPFAFVGSGTSYVLLGAAMVVRGIGIGTSMMPAMTAAFAGLRRDQVADASPQLTVLQRVGGSMGVAVFTVILQSHLSGARTPAASASAFATTYWWVVAISVVALVPAWLLMRSERRALARAQATAKPAADPPTGELALAPEAA